VGPIRLGRWDPLGFSVAVVEAVAGAAFAVVVASFAFAVEVPAEVGTVRNRFVRKEEEMLEVG